VRSDGRLPTSTRRWEASYSHRGTALPATTRRMSKAIGRPAEAAGGSNQALAAGRLAPPRRATTAAPGVPRSDPTDHTATRSLPPVPAPGPGAQNALLLHVPRSLSPPPRRPPSSSNTGSTCVKREDAPQSMTPLQSLYNPRRPRRRSTARRGRETPYAPWKGLHSGSQKGTSLTRGGGLATKPAGGLPPPPLRPTWWVLRGGPVPPPLHFHARAVHVGRGLKGSAVGAMTTTLTGGGVCAAAPAAVNWSAAAPRPPLRP